MTTSPLVVGFDLDQTLYHTEPAIGATLRAVAAELGITFDVDRALTELGPPLDQLVGMQLDPDNTNAVVQRYREIYHIHGLPAAQLLPGARESLAAVRAAGGTSIVITGKNSRDATRHIEHNSLDVQHVIGWAWAQGKTDAMLEHGASIYIGDHPADIAAARAANAIALAVTTGTHGPDSFADADAILTSLTEFPDWLKTHLA
ncbi:HAD family hydrolase [Stackebrandtia nassauensis]|uniref:Haloacid dehalogenase domain protein hydrolase n=1 Tax=Stackebrandtia nassauensis (strain DSM 44728 / CIP 108903 / NRRL B-16338 / NBRC 102104 / LLR-40K-21) TaxID=446470 RepID=D3Q2N1_STANL|nr:HAD hydrolase-like protein [Stackebrandtia nassauensis]ADD45782.1 Haloacid dehalogenase domain protein hydrolase [Stackebrandtia nassauensis DSM 44728]